jgi:bromodomain-containing factor 1
MRRHTTSDDTNAKTGEAPVAKEEAESPASPSEVVNEVQNHDAFAANSNLSEKAVEKPAEPHAQPEDSEMADVNGVAETLPKAAVQSEEPIKPKEAAIASPPPTTIAESRPSAEASVPEKQIEQEEADAHDSMDVDVSLSVEHPDLSSSTNHPASTQTTSAISDSVAVASPQELSQSADVSHLDIQSSPIEAPPLQTEDVAKPRSGSPAKASREREEDASDDPAPPAKRAKTESPHESAENSNDESGPAAKRARTEAQHEHAEDSIGVATSFSPAAASSAAALVDDVPDDQAISLHQSKVIRQLIANIKKKKSGLNFRHSVERLWPGIWEQYKQLVDRPVDLSLFEHKLRDERYANYGEFKTDVKLLYENAQKFNGPTHLVTMSAGEVQREIFEKLSDIAKQNQPTKSDKGKSQPTRHAEPRAAAPPRRQSHPQSHPPASSPKSKVESTAPTPTSATAPTPTSATAPAFALPPNGIPQIRRDSTREDGDRPKRPIHPPKNRDLDYQAAKTSRKKKLEPELKFYDEILSDVMKQKYYHLNGWFLEPVNPITLNIPTYFNVIKKPIDLGTMTEKLADGQYRNGKEVEKDLHLMVQNSETFNGPDSEVTRAGKQLENLFKDKIAEKDVWMTRHYPSLPAPASPELSGPESEEESEAEADEEEDETIRSLQSRVAEEQEKLNALLTAKKPDLIMLEAQQQVLSILQRKLLQERTRFSESRKLKPKRKISKHKSKSHGAAGGNGKKIASASTVKKAQTLNKKAGPKKKVIGAIEKAVIAEGINELDGPTLNKAVDIIKKDTHQKVNLARLVEHLGKKN